MTQIGKKSYLSNLVIDTEVSHQNGLDLKKSGYILTIAWKQNATFFYRSWNLSSLLLTHYIFV